MFLYCTNLIVFIIYLLWVMTNKTFAIKFNNGLWWNELKNKLYCLVERCLWSGVSMCRIEVKPLLGNIILSMQYDRIDISTSKKKKKFLMYFPSTYHFNAVKWLKMIEKRIYSRYIIIIIIKKKNFIGHTCVLFHWFWKKSE